MKRTRLMRTLGWLVAVGALLAFGSCGDDGGVGNGELWPVSGLWNYYDGGIVANDCGTDDVVTDPDATFGLYNNGDGTFTVDQGNAGDPFLCTLTGSSFNCPERLSGSSPVQNYDITLHYTVSITGTFQSNSSMSGEQQVDVTCEGTDCPLAGQAGYNLPCTYTVAFTASAR